MTSIWHEAFDDTTQCTYYYNTETGETSWTLPSTQEEGYQHDADLTFMVFAVVRLQARLRGHRDRRRVVRMVRARYLATIDPETRQTLYTDRVLGVSSWHPPTLLSQLGEDLHDHKDDEDDDDDDDDVDFDALQYGGEHGAVVAEEEGGGDEDGDDSDDGTNTVKKKTRTFPRSPAQLRVDAAEDEAPADAITLDMSGLNAWRLSTRIWNLATLTRLSLAHNQLARIPSGIQDLVRLQHLDLSHNHLTRLPSCLQTTSTLRYLNASHNRITTFSPKLWKLRGLVELDLGWNALEELPYVEGDLKLLRDTREWQVGVGLLDELRVLDLSHNKLSRVPTSIEKCAILCVLDLSHNRLHELMGEVGEIHALVELRLSSNALSELPETIGALGNLTRLAVDSNKLTTVPESIGNLHSLVEIDLRHNQLHHLPEAFGALGHLQLVHLDGNARLASLAMCLRFLPSVVAFSAAACGLVAFDSTDFLCKAPVTRLCLRGNSLIDFPVNLERSTVKTTLTELVLAQNSLHSFPMEIVFCSALVTLDLSHNRLRTLPSETAKLRSLRSLVLSHNELGPSLSEAVAWLPQLRELRCDHNQLTTLPLAIGILKKLELVDVGFNAIATLPTSFLDLGDSLRSLHVNDNRLTVAPPVVALLSPLCFVDLSNNPFCTETETATEQGTSPQRLYAAAVKCFGERQYGQAEESVTRSLSLLENAGEGRWQLRKAHVSTHFYLRGLARYRVAKEARVLIVEASQTIDDCEQQLHGELLERQRAWYRERKQISSSTNESAKELDERPESEETNVSTDEPAVKLPTRKVAFISNQHESSDPTRERLEAAQQRRTTARNRATDATTGALADLNRAIALGIPELSTALVVQGHLFTETLEFPRAIESFTHALDRLVYNSDLLPVTSVSVLLARADAYRLLGQLPAALNDVHRITTRLAPASPPPESVLAKAAALSHEWAVQQCQYFVDHESLFRGYDVDFSSGLARRPEIHDPHAVSVGTRQQQRLDREPETPTERFDDRVRTLVSEREAVHAATQLTMGTTLTQKQLLLSRARAFQRELHENLVMEMEEHTQRRVETELARLVELTRQEMDREFNERLVMAYEDEYMTWLVSEQWRREAEKRRREDDAHRRAEAKAQYETRLARRGGRRQQQATRGKGSR